MKRVLDAKPMSDLITRPFGGILILPPYEKPSERKPVAS